jgi:hypothetical protein
MPPPPHRTIPIRRLTPPALRTVLRLLALAIGWALAPPPLQAQPTSSDHPQVLRSVPPEPKANSALEEALRQVLVPVRMDDGQGHGPIPGAPIWRGMTRIPAPVPSPVRPPA